MEEMLIEEIIEILNKVRKQQVEIEPDAIDSTLSFMIKKIQKKEKVEEEDLVEELCHALDLMKCNLKAGFRRRAEFVDSLNERERTVPVQIKEEERFLTVREAAKILGVSHTTVYSFHIPNGLRTVRPTGVHQKVMYSDLMEYMRYIKHQSHMKAA